MEVKALKMLETSTIPYLYGVYNTTNNFILHQEYIKGQTLRVFLKNNSITENQCFEITWRLIQTLYSIFTKGFVHRDIKPSNIMVRKEKKIVLKPDVTTFDKNTETINNRTSISDTNKFQSKTTNYVKTEVDEFMVYLIDYGFALIAHDKEVRKELMLKICGTKGYIAPEIIISDTEEKRDKLDYSKIDIFSVGIILYELITKKNPFCENTSGRILKNNMKCSINFKDMKIQAMSHDRRDFLYKLCHKDPAKR